MKDRLGTAAWWNAPPRNPTQTRYTRFVKTPWGELGSDFDRAAKEFGTTMVERLSTAYLTDTDIGGIGK